MYSVEQSEQTLIFVASLGVGFLLGILYDIFRALRLSFTKGKAAIVIFDLLYFFAVAFLSFLCDNKEKSCDSDLREKFCIKEAVCWQVFIQEVFL